MLREAAEAGAPGGLAGRGGRGRGGRGGGRGARGPTGGPQTRGCRQERSRPHRRQRLRRSGQPPPPQKKSKPASGGAPDLAYSRWTREELEALITGIERFITPDLLLQVSPNPDARFPKAKTTLNWAGIKEAAGLRFALRYRTTVNLKDKARNIYNMCQRPFTDMRMPAAWDNELFLRARRAFGVTEIAPSAAAE